VAKVYDRRKETIERFLTLQKKTCHVLYASSCCNGSEKDSNSEQEKLSFSLYFALNFITYMFKPQPLCKQTLGLFDKLNRDLQLLVNCGFGVHAEKFAFCA
jgi:hypothetical protein